MSMWGPWYRDREEDMTDEEITEALEQNVRDGFLEHAGTSKEGERLYRLTPEGEERAKALLREIIGPQ